MLENFVWHAVIASAGLLVCAACLVRYVLSRRVSLKNVQQFYDVNNDMPVHVLREVTGYDDFRLDLGHHKGPGWEFELRTKGLIRPFLWVHAFYLWDWARDRAREHPTLFNWLHLGGFTFLLAFVYPKVLLWPQVNDVLMLVGYDAVAAARPMKRSRMAVKEAEVR